MLGAQCTSKNVSTQVTILISYQFDCLFAVFAVDAGIGPYASDLNNPRHIRELARGVRFSGLEVKIEPE